MAEERYIDPNSGAAPQPGGFAGSAPVLAAPEKAKASTPPESDPKKADKAEEKAAEKAVSNEAPRPDSPSEGRGGNEPEKSEDDGPVAPADEPKKSAPAKKSPAKKAAKKAPAKKAPAKKS